jgi:hypothetical protein
MKNEELDVPLKHSDTSYTLSAPTPWDSSSASKCQSFTYNPSPFPDSHKSRTSLNGLSVRANSPYSGVEVSATGTIWLPYFLRAFSFGFDGPPLDAMVHSVRDGQWAVDEAERRKGVLGRRCCDCFKVRRWSRVVRIDGPENRDMSDDRIPVSVFFSPPSCVCLL